MADKDDLKLDIEEEEPASDQPMEPGPPAEEHAGSEVAGNGPPVGSDGRETAPRRMLVLLLLLLILAVGGAAWFYFSHQPAQEPLARGVVPTQTRTLPVPAREPAPTPAPAPSESQPVAAPGAEAESSGAEPGDAKADAAEVEGRALEEDSVTPPVVPRDSGVAANGEPRVPAETVQDLPAPIPLSPAPPVGEFTVQVGAYAAQPTLAEAKKKVRALGYEPQVREVQTTRSLTRLRVGTFFPSQGEAKLAEIRQLGDSEPFFLMDGDLMVVYAGTFQTREHAQRFAGQLQKQGVHVEEENVRAAVPLSIVRFGDFATRAEAEAAAARARDMGMETLIVKRR